MIEVIQIDLQYYPRISTVSKTKESERRVFWRTKQNLDVIYLMNFCQSKGTFYVHLEDDIITRVSIKFWTLGRADYGSHQNNKLSFIAIFPFIVYRR